MSGETLIQEITARLKDDKIHLSETEVENLLTNMINFMDEQMEDGRSVSIDNLGVFGRRKSGNTVYNWFKSIGRLEERVKRLR
jgi:nucleoid DNA-binding protein